MSHSLLLRSRMPTPSSIARGPSSLSTGLLDTLRKAVEGSTMSKRDIAARAGISRKALYCLLAGTGDPRLSTLDALSHVLGLDVFVAPKALHAVRLSSPTSDQLSVHSRVRRLLQRNAKATPG